MLVVVVAEAKVVVVVVVVVEVVVVVLGVVVAVVVVDITRSLPSSQLLEDNGDAPGGAPACVTDCPLIVCIDVSILIRFTYLFAENQW